MTKKLTFLVTVKVNEEITVAQVAKHIRNSVEWLGGKYNPEIIVGKASVKSFHRNGAK